MIKGTEKAPAIRFRGFTDDWEQRKLGELATFNKGAGYSKSDLKASGTQIILYGRLYTKYETVIKQVDTFVDSRPGSVYSEGGEVIVPASGETAEDIAIASVVEKPGILLGGDLNIIHPIRNLDSTFLAISISNGEPHKEMAKRAQGKSVVHLHNDDLSQIKFRYPSIEEQSKISKFFSNLDHLITLHQHKLEQQKKLKAFFLKNMFPEQGETVPRIRFKEFTGDWEQCKLGEIGTTFSGLSGKAKEDFGHGEAQFVTYMNVYLNAVSDSSMTERVEIDDHQNKVQYGDVFFTTSSETPDEVGMASVWFGSKDNTYLNSFCFGFRPTKEIDPYYMAFMLRSDIIRRKIIILAQGISRYNLSKKQVMKIVVPLPELSEQYKIGAYLQSLDHLITLHQRKLDQLQVMKKFMLQNLFV